MALSLLVLGAIFLVAPVVAEGDGKAVFEAQKCDLCHSVSSAGIEATTKSDKMKGPDLVNLTHDAEWLTKYLKKEVDKDGKQHTKPFKGTDEELEALVDWLLAQKSE
jgi:cytochrome c551/c552